MDTRDTFNLNVKKATLEGVKGFAKVAYSALGNIEHESDFIPELSYLLACLSSLLPFLPSFFLPFLPSFFPSSLLVSLPPFLLSSIPSFFISIIFYVLSLFIPNMVVKMASLILL